MAPGTPAPGGSPPSPGGPIRPGAALMRRRALPAATFGATILPAIIPWAAQAPIGTESPTRALRRTVPSLWSLYTCRHQP